MRAKNRRMTVLSLAAGAVVVLGGVAHAGNDLVVVTEPTSSCTYTVYGPEITMYPGPKPAFSVDGGAGVRADCP